MENAANKNEPIQFAIDRLTELKEYWENDEAYDYDVSQQADCDALEIAINVMKYGTVCDKDCANCLWVSCVLEDDKVKEKTNGKKEETGDISKGEKSASDSGGNEDRRDQDIKF
jgi:hypothetical protein